jgi:hypothetical protein
MNKTKPLRNGSRIIHKDEMSILSTNLSVAKGLLATLSLEHPSLWTNKLRMIQTEHLRILLKEAMDEICIAEKVLEQILT